MRGTTLLTVAFLLAGCASAERVTPIARLEDLDKPPHAIFRPDPDYTEIWQRSRIEATAVVSLTIEENGRVANVALEATTQPEMGKAAVEAVKEWRFDPPTSHGKPARVRLKIAIDGEASVKFKEANQAPSNAGQRHVGCSRTRRATSGPRRSVT
jgi:TonB family protein